MQNQTQYQTARQALKTPGLPSSEVVRWMVVGYNSLRKKCEPLTQEEQEWLDWCETKLSNWRDY